MKSRNNRRAAGGSRSGGGSGRVHARPRGPPSVHRSHRFSGNSSVTSGSTYEDDTTLDDTTVGDTTVGDTTVGDTTVGDTTVGDDTATLDDTTIDDSATITSVSTLGHSDIRSDVSSEVIAAATAAYRPSSLLGRTSSSRSGSSLLKASSKSGRMNGRSGFFRPPANNAVIRNPSHQKALEQSRRLRIEKKKRLESMRGGGGNFKSDSSVSSSVVSGHSRASSVATSAASSSATSERTPPIKNERRGNGNSRKGGGRRDALDKLRTRSSSSLQQSKDNERVTTSKLGSPRSASKKKPVGSKSPSPTPIVETDEDNVEAAATGTITPATTTKGPETPQKKKSLHRSTPSTGSMSDQSFSPTKSIRSSPGSRLDDLAERLGAGLRFSSPERGGGRTSMMTTGNAGDGASTAGSAVATAVSPDEASVATAVSPEQHASVETPTRRHVTTDGTNRHPLEEGSEEGISANQEGIEISSTILQSPMRSPSRNGWAGDDGGSVASHQFAQMTQRLKVEWERGTEENTRYADGETPPRIEEQKEYDDESSYSSDEFDDNDEASVPPSEFFTLRATEAINKLLAPERKTTFASDVKVPSSVEKKDDDEENGEGGEGLSDTKLQEHNDRNDAQENANNQAMSSPEDGGISIVCTKPAAASQEGADDAISVMSGSVASNKDHSYDWGDGTSCDGASASAGGSSSSPAEIEIHPPNESPVIDEATQMMLDRVPTKLIKPSKQLADLLRAVISPQPTDDVGLMDRGYAVRRKNACGALKVLTATKKNRRQIGWTVGVLGSLTSVLVDSGEGGAEATFGEDPTTLAAYLEARRRAVAALLNLSMATHNRILMCHSPGLLKALGKVLNEDKEGESGMGCCATLAYLAKSAENRLLMVRVPGLVKAMTDVIRPLEVPEEEGKKKKKHKRKTWDDYLDSEYELDSSSGEDDASVTSESDDESATSDEGDKYEGAGEEDEAHDEEEADGTTAAGSIEVEMNNPRKKKKRNKEYEEDGGTRCSTPLRKGGLGEDPEEETGDGSINKDANDDDHQAENEDKPISPIVDRKDYDKNANQFLQGGRQSVFAALLHLVKAKDNTYRLARNEDFISTLMEISNLHSTPSHAHAVAIFANLTRHGHNPWYMINRAKHLLPTLVNAAISKNDDARKFALFALQNLSYDKTCRQDVANTHYLLQALCQRAVQTGFLDHQLAAVTTMKNLADDPANIIPMTNTPDCLATIMQVAHGQEDFCIDETMQYIACDTLATLSHWLRKIATSGLRMDIAIGMNSVEGGGAVLENKPADIEYCDPTFRTSKWEQWT